MTPTLMGRLQTRVFLAATIGVLWTAAITPVLPRPAGMSSTFAYHVTFEALGLMTLLGLGWEIVYHVLQQARWDKDWPSVFALLVVVSEAIPLWYVTHILNVIPGTTRLSSPIVPLYVIHVGTTWVLTWLFMQGPLRVLHVRWRFEGGKVLVRAPGRARRRPSGWPGAAGSVAARSAPAAAQPIAAVQPASAAARDGAAAAAATGNLAEGVLCRHGHFSHPDARYCVICGSAVLPLTGARTPGPPPPAGLLILPDGGTMVLDHDLTVTAPESSDDLGFLPLGEHPRAVAHIRIVGWQPVVSSPAHAMSLLLPGGSQLRAEPGVPVPLVPGAELAVGEYRIRYESPHQAGPLSPAAAGMADLRRPAPSSRRASQPVRRRHAAVPMAAAAGLGVLMMAAGRLAAAGRTAGGWMMGQPGRGARRGVAAGAVTAALVTALMLGFAGHLADRHGGAGQQLSGPDWPAPSGSAAPGARPSGTAPRPGISASPAGYTLAAPGPPGRRGAGTRPLPGHQAPTGTPGPPSSSPGPTPSSTPTPTRTPTGSPSPTPTPTGTRPPSPGSCLKLPLGLLTLRVCGL